MFHSELKTSIHLVLSWADTDFIRQFEFEKISIYNFHHKSKVITVWIFKVAFNVNVLATYKIVFTYEDKKLCDFF